MSAYAYIVAACFVVFGVITLACLPSWYADVKRNRQHDADLAAWDEWNSILREFGTTHDQIADAFKRENKAKKGRVA